MRLKMKNISRNFLTHADIKNPPNSNATGENSYLSTEINAKSNGGEVGIRTRGPSYPGQLPSRQLHSATLPPLPSKTSKMFLTRPVSRFRPLALFNLGTGPGRRPVKTFIFFDPIFRLPPRVVQLRGRNQGDETKRQLSFSPQHLRGS